MNYLELLKNSSTKFNSIVSMGLDPVIEDIPIKGGSIKKRIISFYEEILNGIIQRKIYPGAVKPNYAFYAQYGLEGIEALISVIDLYKKEGLPVILDVKRGDISKTALAYAKESFDFFKADSVTLAPYMGYDSISPFMDNYPEKGFYILNKTSNKSSMDFQDIKIDDTPLFLHVTKKIIEWHKPGIGAVVGATYPDQLVQITELLSDSKKDVALLIPGVGSQGGSLAEVLNIVKTYSDYRIHRINSSSGINYAYKNQDCIHFTEAAVNELKNLNEEISSVLEK